MCPLISEKRILKRIKSLIGRVQPRNSFVRSVFVLVGGTVGGQAILVLSAPFLTRLYSPQDFGLLAVFGSLLALVTVVASLRYEQAILLPESDEEAAALFVLSLLTMFLVIGVVAIPILLFRHEIAQMLNTPRIADALYLVVLGAIFAGTYAILKAWALRMKAFVPIAKTKFNQSIIATGIQLGGASFGPIALLLGQIAGQGSGSLALYMRVLRSRRDAIRNVGMADIVRAARRYKAFPLFSTWGALFNTAGSQLPSIMLAALFSPAAAGIYILANRVLSMPMQLLGQSIAQVFYSGAVQANREGLLAPMVANIHKRLAHIGMPPLLVLILAGPEIFGHVFGDAWTEAGVFARWMAPWLYLVFITSPLASVGLVLERLAAGMAFQATLLTVRLAAIITGAWYGDLRTAVALFGCGSAVCWLGNLIWVFKITGNTWHEIWRSTLMAFMWSAALVSPVLAGMVWGTGQSPWFVPLAAAILLITTRYVFLMKNAWL